MGRIEEIPSRKRVEVIEQNNLQGRSVGLSLEFRFERASSTRPRLSA